MKSPTLKFLSILGFIIISFIIFSGSSVYAEHSFGVGCYQCHTLKSSDIIGGSRSISSNESYLGWPAAPQSPPGDGSTTYVEGGPFDCSFCHFITNDIPDYFEDGVEAATGDGSPAEESSHPVDVITDEDDAANEIACADCHGQQTNPGYYDVSPFKLNEKNDDDGYPNHREIDPVPDAGYSLYKGVGGGDSVDYPIDASNKSHLSVPYGYSQSEGGTPLSTGYFGNRFVDWGESVNPLSRDTMLCFVCHDGAADSFDYTLSGVMATDNIEAEYSSVDDQGLTAGHVIRINGAGGSDISAGDKMPCFNCHASHAVADSGGNRKLIRNSVRLNPYGTSTFFVDVNYLGSGGATDERDICDKCHDTGLDASQPNLSGIVKGIDAVDPYNSATAASFHGSVGEDIATSSVNCLISTGGCHKNTHNPKASGGSCWDCHGGATAETVGGMPRVINDDYGLWGRGGDFGSTTTTSFTAAPGPVGAITSAHNIDFDDVSTGEDGTLTSKGKTKGSCTICHTIEDRPNAQNYHADGDPRNDFIDIDTDPIQKASGGTTNVQPVLIEDATHDGYYYDPPWLMCLECHDDEGDSSKEWYNIIGNGTPTGGIAALNIDEMHGFERVDGTTVNDYYYVYGSGDHDTKNRDYKFTSAAGDYPDKLAAPDPPLPNPNDLNATPVNRYNLQPYKAHYYQTTGVTAGELWTTEITRSLTDPIDPTYDSGAEARIMDCLDCHNGHGSTNASLYRSPDPNYASNHGAGGIQNANGRDICLDCHDPGSVPTLHFPPQIELMSQNYSGPYDTTYGTTLYPPVAVDRPMWAPPVEPVDPDGDRYDIIIDGHSDVSVSCADYEPSDNTLFKCHNPHSPSCETCHEYPPEVVGGVDSP
jgi:hypothetical protein